MDVENMITVNQNPIKCAENTGAVVDWLSFTIFEIYGDYRDVLAWLTPPGVDENEWYESTGKYGYRQGRRRGGVYMMYDGLPGMGVHVSLSGAACRQLEEEWGIAEIAARAGVSVERVWINWLCLLYRADGVNLSRVDVAKDDFDNLLDMGIIKESIKAGSLSSSFRIGSIDKREKIELGKPHEETPGGDAETIYFGKRSSEMYVKIYNKQKERLEKNEPASDTGHWVRLEVTFKDRKLDNFLNLLCQVPSFAVAWAWVQQSLSFREPADGDTNKSRWEVCSWWSGFFENVGRLGRVATKKAVKTLGEYHAWVARQVAPVLSVLVDVIAVEAKKYGRCARYEVRKYITSLLENGRGRRKSKHKNLLSESLDAVKRSPLGSEVTRFRLSWDSRSAPLLSGSPVSVVPVVSVSRFPFVPSAVSGFISGGFRLAL
jgi:DNA relaxase NicK